MIVYFSQKSFSPQTPQPGSKPAHRAEPTTLAPQTNRIFVIVLGRGRLQGPSKGIDALQRFVREQLLPQDQVAVLACNRAMDFTTDHEKVAQMLERFKSAHESIDLEVGLELRPGSVGLVRLKLKASLVKGQSGYELQMQVNADPTRLAFTVANGVHVGELDVAVMCANEAGQVVGNSYQRVDLKLTEDDYQRARKDGVPYYLTMPIGAGARKVRVIVYDYKADVIGTANANVI